MFAAAVCVMTKKYVRDADGHGWLIVKYDDGSKYPPIPQLTLVESYKVENNREYFTILEGRSKGVKASVIIPANDAPYLLEFDKVYNNVSVLYRLKLNLSAAKVDFNMKTSQLWYGDMKRNQPGLSMEINPDKPPNLGTYALEIPDEVHSLGERYLDESPYATTWFRIGNSGDRYLHSGRVSLGCATVKDLGKWTELYYYLIQSRKGDGKNVGTISIFK